MDDSQRPLTTLGHSVSAAYLQGLLDHFERLGLDPKALLDQVGLSPAALTRREQRVAASVYLEVLDAGLRLTDDPLLGLHLGEAVRPGYYGVLGFLLMSCATLADALHRHARYTELVGSLGWVELADEPAESLEEAQVALTWRAQLVLPAQQHWQLADETLAGWVTFGRSITGPQFSPSLVRFQHAEPADLSEYQRIFCCPLLFNQADNALVFARRLLALPLIQADAQMSAVLDSYAERLLLALQQSDSIPDQVRRLLLKQLPELGADLDYLAEQLQLSPRTLQRRLREAGLSFNQLVDETRRQLVLHHLHDTSLQLADIAMLVGFSESGSLLRAFRRWTGQNLADFRQQLKSS